MRYLLLLLIVLPVAAANAQDWSQFRGGTGGKLQKVTHPIRWDKETNLAWAIPMQGSGWSSPVVVGDRIFLTSAIADDGAKPKGMMAGVSSMRTYKSATPSKQKFVVKCFSLKDGSEIWSKDVGETVPEIVHPSNTYATESPATDGKSLFTFFATTGTLVAWDFDGKELWRKELGNYQTGAGFGTGSSLAVFGDRVFVQYDNDEKSFLAAFETKSGEPAWRDERTTKTSWSTPLIWNRDSKPELIACGSGIVTSYDPSSGDVLWRLDGIKSGFSASPAIDADRIYFGHSGPTSVGPLVAVPAGIRGEFKLDENFESDKIEWSRTRSGPGLASPVSSNGRLYIPGSNGILSCYDVKTGERVYQTRVPKMKTVAASLWADEDRVFILDENGTTFVIATGPEFKLLESNSIKDLFWSTPAIVGDTLLLRGVEKLYCIRK